MKNEIILYCIQLQGNPIVFLRIACIEMVRWGQCVTHFSVGGHTVT